MSPIYLDSLDEFMLARIVKKFNSVHTGANFYRSCRGTRDLVDRIKPVWPLPRHRLLCEKNRKGVCAGKKRNRGLPYLTSCDFEGTWGEMQVLGKSLPPLEWCRIEDLSVGPCSDDYFKDVLVPEIKAMGAVKLVYFMGKLSEEQMQQVMAAAKPEFVFLSLYHYDMISATLNSIALKDVKNLRILADGRSEELEHLWESKKIFELMSSRKTITWSFGYFWKKCIVPILQNWLKGDLTDSWEKHSLKAYSTKEQLEEMEEVLNEPEIENLMRSCAKLPNGYVLERKAGGRLRISIDSDVLNQGRSGRVDFSFS